MKQSRGRKPIRSKHVALETISSLDQRFTKDRGMTGSTDEEIETVAGLGPEALAYWDNISPSGQAFFAGVAAAEYEDVVIRQRYPSPGAVPNNEYQQFIDAVKNANCKASSLRLAKLIPALAPDVAYLWDIGDFVKFAESVKQMAAERAFTAMFTGAGLAELRELFKKGK